MKNIFWETNKTWVFQLKQPSVVHLYNRQTKRQYASRIYARGKERFRLGTDTKQMLAQLRTSMKLIDNRKDIVREKIVISTKLLHHF